MRSVYSLLARIRTVVRTFQTLQDSITGVFNMYEYIPGTGSL